MSARNGTRRPTVDLAVTIGPMLLANPILTASGTFGYGDEYAHVVDVAALGGVITKTVTLEPRSGNPPQRIAETAGGMLNSIGLENVGLATFRREKLPKLRSLGANIVASVGGETPHELERLLRALGHEPGIAGFEINPPGLTRPSRRSGRYGAPDLSARARRSPAPGAGSDRLRRHNAPRPSPSRRTGSAAHRRRRRSGMHCLRCR